MGVPFKFEIGHTVVLKDQYGEEKRYYVRAVQADGWLFEPHDRLGAREHFSGERVMADYCLARLRYVPYDHTVLATASLRRLEEAWECQSLTERTKAERKVVFVRRVQKNIREGMRRGTAIRDAATSVIEEHGDKWRLEDQAEAAAEFKVRVKARPLRPGQPMPMVSVMAPPSERSIWAWLKRFAQSGDDVRSLLNHNLEKGRRGSRQKSEVEEELKAFFKDAANRVMTPGAARKIVNRILKAKGLPEVTSKVFAARRNAELDKKQQIAGQRGQMAARKYGRTTCYVDLPEYSTHHVEIDHTLINLNVEDDHSAVVLGRPWLTAIIDRMSRAIYGLHISFLAPSWATLSRCIAHAVSPKILTDYPSVMRSWNQHGVFDTGYTDRGMDLISGPSHAAAGRMRYDLLALPGFSPWLKGSLERWNRTYKSEIMSYRDGVTSFQNPDHDPRKYATVKLSELIAHTLKWAVEEYNFAPHTSLGGNCPAEYFQDKLGLIGSPRPVHDFAELRRAIAWPELRTIQHYGVEINGYQYTAPELVGMRRRHGDFHSFNVLYNMFDMGYIELLDPAEKRWIVLRNKRPDIAAGVPLYRSELFINYAAELKRGESVNYDDMAKAKEFLENDADRVRHAGKTMLKRGVQNVFGRYLDSGTFMTPVPLIEPLAIPKPVLLDGWASRNGILTPSVSGGTALALPPGFSLDSMAPGADRAGQETASLENGRLVLDTGNKKASASMEDMKKRMAARRVEMR